MRAVVLTFLITSALVFSGCIGGGDDLEDSDAPEVVAVDALTSAIQTDGTDRWLTPGEAIDVSVTPPADAVGNVTYTWLIQPDPFTIFTQASAIDTGELLSGESGDLVFNQSGFYEYGHCDPHPWMKHTVAVLDGNDGPDHVDVYIVEGDVEDTQTWKFVPEHITIATGTTVTYTNLGMVPHTASVAHDGEAVPVPTVLDLTEASGTVTVSGDDWMNLVVIMHDETGNGGYAKQRVFVREKFDTAPATHSDSFNAAWPNQAGEAPDSSLTPQHPYPHDFQWSGTVHLDVSVDDPTETLNQVRVSLRETKSDARPDPQVLFTSEAVSSGAFSVPIQTGIPLTYEVVVTPAQGALIEYTIEVSITYDYTPPELVQLPCPEPHYSMGHC